LTGYLDLGLFKGIMAIGLDADALHVWCARKSHKLGYAALKMPKPRGSKTGYKRPRRPWVPYGASVR
jgi:hypothetical protein